jgi:hypothetical protein
MHVKSLTLRDVPPDVARRIHELARDEGISLNKAAVRLLRDAVRGEHARRGPPYDDLDALAGTWSEAEAKTFDEALAEQRTIDRKMWR